MHKVSASIFVNSNGSSKNICLPFAITANDKAGDGSESEKKRSSNSHCIILFIFHCVIFSFILLSSVN